MTDKEIMVEYLLLKVRQEDWHGVSDAAVDIREMEAKNVRRFLQDVPSQGSKKTRAKNVG
jgi:hypothetical protein